MGILSRLMICLIGLSNIATSTTPRLESIIVLGENNSSYGLDYIDPGLYIYNNGYYFGAFFVSGSGVIVIDSPSFMGDIVSTIIKSVTSEDIIYVIYSHHHSDHIGGAYQFPLLTQNTEIEYICHKDASEKIDQGTDFYAEIPSCDITIDKDDQTESSDSSDDSDSSDSRNRRLRARSKSSKSSLSSSSSSSSSYSASYKLRKLGILEIGNQSINLDYYGRVHSDGNLWIFSSQHSFLMVVDFVCPGWIPYRFFNMVGDVEKYIFAHSIAISNYEFDYYVGGHVDEIGDKHDIEINEQFVSDLYDAALSSLTLLFSTFGADATQNDNSWTILNRFQDDVVELCVEILRNNYNGSEWYQTWNGIDTFIEDDCWWAQEDLLINL